MNDRIVVDPGILCGRPVIRGTRIPVYLIMNLLGAGKDPDEIVVLYPTLTREDVLAAARYAGVVLEQDETYVLGETGV